MCFHPIKIRNPSLYFSKEIDKPWIEVPCGHCEDCLKRKVNDLIVRGYYEWQKTISKGGFCYFDTLTYSNDSVPKLFGEMVFSRQHLTDFFKLIRRRLERAGFAVNNQVGVDKNGKPIIESNLKYLVTTEYGEDDQFTRRPHYHLIWFCSIPGLRVFDLYKFTRDVWLHYYHFGWNDKITDVMSHVINRVDGISYVCKYLSKQSDHIDRLMRLLEKFKDEPVKLSVVLGNIKNIVPFYRSSIGVGASIMELDYKTLEKHGVPYYTSSGPEFMPIPQYIKNKLYYEHVKHPFKKSQSMRRRNSLGVDYLVNNLDNIVEAKVLKYQALLDNYANYSEIGYNLKEYAEMLLDGRSMKDFVIYQTVYKGHLFTDLANEEYNDYFKKWLTTPKDFSPWYCPDTRPIGRSIAKKAFQDFVDDYHHPIIDDRTFERFHGFDELDSIIDLLYCEYDKYLEKTYVRNKQEQSQVAEIYRRFYDNRKNNYIRADRPRL